MKMIPTCIPSEHLGNGHNGPIFQRDLFVYKARQCKSAPARSTDIASNGPPSRISSPKQRRVRISWRKVAQFLFGHAPHFTKWTTSFSSRVVYSTLFFVETTLRSVGDVAFCSNPFSGLLIVFAMFLSCPPVVVLALITIASGILTATVFLHVPENDVRGGGVLFNNMLTGTVIALLAGQDVLWKSPDIIGICIVMGMLTVIVWSCLNGSLAPNLEFPLLNAPFHVVTLLYILSGIAANYSPREVLQIHEESGVSPINRINETQTSTAFRNDTHQMHLRDPEAITLSPTPLHNRSVDGFNEGQTVDWTRVLCGIALAPSHVFGTQDVVTSMLVYFALLLYSPITLLQSVTGVVVGSLVGVCLSNPVEYEPIYDGSWGYNPWFTAAALGGFLVVFNVYSWLLSIVGSVLTALLYSAMVKCHVPVLGIPFMAITWLLLPGFPTRTQSDENNDNNNIAITDTKSQTTAFHRVPLSQITTPEIHRSQLHKENQDHHEKYTSNRPPTAIPPVGKFVLPL